MQTSPLRHLRCNDKDIDNGCFSAFSELRTTESITVGSAPTSAATQSYRHLKSPSSAASESQTPRQTGLHTPFARHRQDRPEARVRPCRQGCECRPLPPPNTWTSRLKKPCAAGDRKKKQPPCGSCCDSK